MTLAIHAFDLSKRYLLGQQSSGYELLSERLRTIGRRPQETREEFWALRDVSFDLEVGETLGVVGHNGAGKSTLLKILSRVTTPTRGGADLNGRVGALLEVGTGFHAELTGAENVYLNGAILGMRRAEIARHFDEIVEFAGIEQFINTPVKRYSSGMYMRLAFAVAAHLEPEILIVDEVLSVGDIAFQEKCVTRMREIARDGRTVLFVSHNIAAVASLCRRSIMLESGRLVADGPTSDVIERFVESVRADVEVPLAERTDRQGTGRLRFRDVETFVDGRATDTVVSGDDVDVVVSYDVEGPPIQDVGFSVSVSTMLGRLMLNLDSRLIRRSFSTVGGSGQLVCRIPRLPLPIGGYTLTLYAYVGGEVLDRVERAATLTVLHDSGEDDNGLALPSETLGVLIDYDWSAA
ncbi:MAG TPA: ABC transporter ATP-binding protein [Capillimicrobium sp.]|nr:ABC transporter ATP-binding protein [Capillimicrobium sp.]